MPSFIGPIAGARLWGPSMEAHSARRPHRSGLRDAAMMTRENALTRRLLTALDRWERGDATVYGAIPWLYGLLSMLTIPGGETQCDSGFPGSSSSPCWPSD